MHTDSLSQLTPEEMTIVCIEVGHCCDGALAEKMADKIAQHEEWLDFLVSKGWTVSYFPIAVTHSGLVTNTATAALRACGVSAAGAATAIRRVACNALDYACKFRASHRHLSLRLESPQVDPG